MFLLPPSFLSLTHTHTHTRPHSQFILAKSHPLLNFSQSRNSYQSGMAKCNMCFLWDMQSMFLNSCVTHSEEIAIYPLLHTHTHRCTQLASVILIDKKKSKAIPPPWEHSIFCSVALWNWHSELTEMQLFIYFSFVCFPSVQCYVLNYVHFSSRL